MKSRLNLTLDQDDVAAIKKFAKLSKQSVSQIVSEQIKILLTEANKNTVPFSKRAAGIISGQKFNRLNDLRDRYLRDEYDL